MDSKEVVCERSKKLRDLNFSSFSVCKAFLSVYLNGVVSKAGPRHTQKKKTKKRKIS